MENTMAGLRTCLAACLPAGAQMAYVLGEPGAPNATSVAPGENGDYTFTLPNASAAVLSIAP